VIVKRHTINMQEAGRAWMDGRLSNRDYFALARKQARTRRRSGKRWWKIWRRKT
jgi:hypothetical protein